MPAPKVRKPESGSTALPAGVSLPLEIRIHGRGGQGGVTCAKIVAMLYAQLGLYVQTFGDYGAERSGAPVRAFTRVDAKPIANRNMVYTPDQLIVLDQGLLSPPVFDGTKPGGLLLLNSPAGIAQLPPELAAYRLGAIDATAIAREHGIGTSAVVIINTTIGGAYARMLDIPLAVLRAAYQSLGLDDDFPAAETAYRQVEIRPAQERAAAAPAAASAPTAPTLALPDHCHDIPQTLATGGWSTQQPVYRQYLAPCNAACPAGNDVVEFIQALKTDGPDAAAQVLLRTQPLPSVCGRVCPAPCMADCNRGHFDGAVNIRSLERWIADHSEAALQADRIENPHAVAVVGGGPAGLSAAYQLALRGHRVTLYEKQAQLGGVLRYGIPAYRLPAEVLERDLARILSLGIEVRCDHPIGPGEMEQLQTAYDAVLVCKGFSDAYLLSVAGEELDGIEQGLDFLAASRHGETSELSGDVVVIGGGNTAIDCARSALRRGAASVKLVYRRSRAEMPAIAEEIDEALHEGVQLLTQRQPVAFRGVGRVAGIVLAEVELGEPGEDGRRHPLISERTGELACSKVLLALGQQNDLALLPPGWQVRAGRVHSEEGKPLNIWLAGDCASADGTVTHAIGNGRRAARVALDTLAGTASPPTEQDATSLVAPAHVRFSHFPLLAPHHDRQRQIDRYHGNFDEVNLGLAGAEEAERCFSCGRCTRCDTCLVYCPDGVIHRTAEGYRIDDAYCKGCGICITECPRRAMDMIDKVAGG